MKIVKLAKFVGLLSLSTVVWAGGQDASAPQVATPAMMQPMHAQMQQTMRVRMQQIVNAKTLAQRQKLAREFMRTMPAQCGARMGSGMMGAGSTMMGSGTQMMGSGAPMMGNGTPMMGAPAQGESGSAAHLLHHPTNASQ